MNLSLQSSLYTPVPEDDLSSYFRRLSSVAAVPASYSSASSSFPPLPLHAGDVLEVHGASNTGKSAVLLSCVLSCALPAGVLDMPLHGSDRSCVLVDCDGRVSVYRLQCMLEDRCSKAWQQHWEAMASSSTASPAAADELRVAASRSRRQAVSLLTQLVLRRLRVVQVSDEVELMAALLTVDRICEAEQGETGQPGTSEQQQQRQMHNIAPYIHDRHRPLFHTRDEDGHDDIVLSHACSIAGLPLPSPSSTTSPLSFVSRYSPVSPIHSLPAHSPDPLIHARQPAHTAVPSTATEPVQPLPTVPPSSSVSVSDMLSALSSLCAAAPPPVELLLVDNIAAFYFAAKNADRLSAVSASSPAHTPTAPTVYSSITTRLRRLLLDRHLSAVITKPPLFAGTASSLQSDWKHSEYMPPEFVQLVRWRMLLRMKADGSRMMEDEEGSTTAADGLDVDDSGGLRECRLIRCREEEVSGVRHAKNTVSFHSTLVHNKEGLVFV